MDLSVANIANIAAWALVGSGALIGLRALCIRRQAKPGCPQCGYDLTSLIAPESTAMPLCPECGHTARSLTHLSRGPVKRRLILIAAALALSSNLIFAIPRVASAGAVGLIPTFALALIHPYWNPTDTPNDSFLLDEMRRRAKDQQLWSPAAELWVLRTELSFWPSSRWGISRAQRATGPLPSLPPPLNFTSQPLAAWIAALIQKPDRMAGSACRHSSPNSRAQTKCHC
jgi:hypothetical protein